MGEPLTPAHGRIVGGRVGDAGMVHSTRKLRPGEHVMQDNDAPVPALASLSHDALVKFRLEQGTLSPHGSASVPWSTVHCILS